MANTWDQLNHETQRRAKPVWDLEDKHSSENLRGVQFEQIVGTQERTQKRLFVVPAQLSGLAEEPAQNLEHSASDGSHLLIGAVALLLGATFSGIRLLTGAAFETGYPFSYAAVCVIGLGLSAVLLSEWRGRRK